MGYRVYFWDMCFDVKEFMVGEGYYCLKRGVKELGNIYMMFELLKKWKFIVLNFLGR